MLERILQSSIRNRVLVVVATLVLALVGAMSLSRLPIDAVPDITNNQVQINVIQPAYSVEDMERLVTFPIETALTGIPGLLHTRSVSRNGFCQVTAVFEEGLNIHLARQQVGERLDRAREDLPEGIEPAMGPITTGLGEVLMWTVEFESEGEFVTPEGERLTNRVQRLAYLRTVQDWLIRPQLRTVPNVADVDAIGGYEKQYHVLPDPRTLQSYGLTLQDVITALERNNSSLGAGFVERHGEAALVRADARLRGVKDIKSVVLKEHRGTPITIGQVAQVEIGGELRLGSGSVNGREAVIGTAMMLSGANSRAVAVDVRAKFDEVMQSLPEGVTARAVLDRSRLVDATIDTVAHNLFYGAMLVVVVLFALLGNFRAAFLTALAIPLSMLLAALGMTHFGISGNLMSLGAIDFGIIIDGSVIIVENCLRRLANKQRELGRTLTHEERLEVTRAASHEVRRATAFGETIIIMVYVPILALAGVEGKLFHPMALTVIFALTAAFILSLTFVPAMVALLVRGKISEGENFLMCTARRVYAPVLDFALRRRVAVVVAALVLLVGTGLGFARMGQVFIPQLDEGDIAMHAMRIPSTGIEQSTRMQLHVENAVKTMPEVEVVFSKTGTADIATDPMPPSVSDTFIIFKPRDQWPDPKLSKQTLLDKLRAAIAGQNGHRWEITQPIEMRFHEMIAGVRGDVAVKVFGDDPVALRATAERVAGVLGHIDGAEDVKVEQTTGMPIITVRPNRAALARLGLDSDAVVDTVNIATGGRDAGQVFQGDRRFDIVVRLPEPLRERSDALNTLLIPLPRHTEAEGTQLTGDPHATHIAPARPLADLATIDRAEGSNQVSRENSKRRVVIQCNVRGRDLAGFVEEARAAIATEVTLPAGAWLAWGGQYEHLLSARARLGVLVPLCFVLIFLLLYTTFRAARPALLVFTGVPLALSGGVAALALRGLPFSISAAVGFIALSGIAVLNGLVLVTFINQLREEGKSLEDAIRNGALTRLRPVLMTALVASLGFLPMALATGTGAEVQRPLATVVIGGILTATALTLIVLPALCRLAFSEKHKSVKTD
ncbi:MAG TPA: CusA/CzcA family heavy metal efflux RND transporter [Verrucomicrobiales bacterium]|nr:CusA/CzcA family heavy metal efflux RND transporter [Verrucomicrobiales bacterium]